MTHLTVGDPAPSIMATDQDGNRIDLDQLIGNKVVLFFYPKDNLYY